MFKKDEQTRILNAVAEAIERSLAATLGRPATAVIEPATADMTGARLKFGAGGRSTWLDVELKMTVSGATVAGLASGRALSKTILFAPRLTSSAMRACRQVGVNCADVDGNLFMRWGSNAVDIEGRPPTNSRNFTTGSDKSTLVISRSGLQLVFVLLSMPDFAGGSLRSLAAAAGTSLGSAAGVVRELTKLGYMVTTPSGRSLRQTRGLLETWVDAYRIRLASRLRLGTFATDVARWWETSNDAVVAARGQWGGETALWALGRNLRPARGVVYTDAVPSSLVGALKLRRDHNDDAPVEFRRRFWNVPALTASATVPTPLIYADLLLEGDPRLVEAAAQLRMTDDDLRRLDQS